MLEPQQRLLNGWGCIIGQVTYYITFRGCRAFPGCSHNFTPLITPSEWDFLYGAGSGPFVLIKLHLHLRIKNRHAVECMTKRGKSRWRLSPAEIAAVR
jgi:hypothetical protein